MEQQKRIQKPDSPVFTAEDYLDPQPSSDHQFYRVCFCENGGNPRIHIEGSEFEGDLDTGHRFGFGLPIGRAVNLALEVLRYAEMLNSRYRTQAGETIPAISQDHIFSPRVFTYSGEQKYLKWKRAYMPYARQQQSLLYGNLKDEDLHDEPEE